MAGFYRQFSDDHKSTTASSKPSSEAGSAPRPNVASAGASPGPAIPQPVYFATSVGMPAAQAPPPGEQGSYRFCAQCGNATKTGDRFCASCGCSLEEQRRGLRGVGSGAASLPHQAAQHPHAAGLAAAGFHGDGRQMYAPAGMAGPAPMFGQQQMGHGGPHLLDHIRRLRCIEASESDVELARLACLSFLQGGDGYVH